MSIRRTDNDYPAPVAASLHSHAEHLNPVGKGKALISPHQTARPATVSRFNRLLMSSLEFTLVRGIVSLVGAMVPCVAGAQLTVVPASPRQFETVRVEARGEVLGNLGSFAYIDPRLTQVSMAGNQITVTVVNRGLQPGEVAGSPAVVQPLGQFPAGTYGVEIRVINSSGLLQATTGSTTFAVAPVASNSPIFNLTDIWWLPSESGWGIYAIQKPSGIMLLSLLHYSSDGSPVWYVATNMRTTQGLSFIGTLYRTSGPALCLEVPGRTDCPQYNPAAMKVTEVGRVEMVVSELDYESATVNVVMDGKYWRRNLRRQSF